MKKQTLLPVLLLVTLTFFGCKNYKKVPEAAFQEQSHPAAPNFALMENWAAHPDRDDFADGTPCEDVCDRQGNAPVDVFFLHPTTFYNGDNWNAALTDSALNKKTDETAIMHQASIFNGTGRVFAPRYRQAVYGSFFVEGEELRSQKQALELAFSDICRAFEYYLENENQGRPILVAGHSQGSLHAMNLLRKYFDGKPLQNQLVTAYVVGWPVFADSFQVLKPCTNPGEAGCYNTWCTFHWDYYPDFYDEFFKGAVVTNPINWTIDGTYASAEEHKGGVLRDYERFYPETVDAQAKDGILWVHSPKFGFPKKMIYNWKNYHIADYNLFWKDVRENAKTRTKTFLGQKPLEVSADSEPEGE